MGRAEITADINCRPHHNRDNEDGIVRVFVRGPLIAAVYYNGKYSDHIDADAVTEERNSYYVVLVHQGGFDAMLPTELDNTLDEASVDFPFLHVDHLPHAIRLLQEADHWIWEDLRGRAAPLPVRSPDPRICAALNRR